FSYLFRRGQGVSRVYVVWRKKSRIGNVKSPSRDPAFERCTENYNGAPPWPRVFPERTTPESRDRARAERSRPPAVLFASTQQQPELLRFSQIHCPNCAVWTSRTIPSKPMLYLSRR